MFSELPPGLYEQVVNRALSKDLSLIQDERKHLVDIDEAEASSILSQYLSSVIKKGLDVVLEQRCGDVEAQIKLVNQIIGVIKSVTQDTDLSEMSVEENAQLLLALLKEKDERLALGKKASDVVIRPESSIAQSSLFTGALYEPQMFTELKKEISSADRIDMLVSFIKWSGLRLMIDELKEFTKNGGKLRIITTSYMGATDVKAIDELNKLQGTEIKVSYDTKRTRLHAKTYVFYRNTGFTTAYVGSSNMSNAALSSGLEWNIKVTKKDLPETIDKIEASFESYWNSTDFEYYSDEEKSRLELALKGEKYQGFNSSTPIFTLDVTPYSYQQEILEKLESEREVRGYYRNLLVAATGTGKTVISALDYKRFRKKNAGKPCRLLFVAHREEILRQSRATFQAVLKDANFGELLVGDEKAEKIDYLFISIQSLNSKAFLEKTRKDFYDFIIVDEFHHAAAPTYQKLLSYYEPRILLGLTATPERMDGRSILPYFNNRIAAEIRLPEAIDRKLLCPFQYFGVTDNVDLDALRWVNGGYDKRALTDLYTHSDKRAKLIVEALLKYVTDIDDVKGLGFCVTIAHAQYMTAYFNNIGIPSMCLTGSSADEERKNAKDALVRGKVRFIFVVDIYNEGVDIPEVNTVLFLRPTESLTVFLQQLGRGLRLSDDKECLTVLDFIGQANKKYNFEDKFSALLSNAARSVTKEIKEGFVYVPKGCSIQLERIAAKHILDNIRASYGSTAGLVSRLATFEEDTNQECTLENFLRYYHLDPRAIYKTASFSRLCVRAGVMDDFNESLEDLMSKAFARFAVADSRRWLKFLLEILPRLRTLDLNTLSDKEKRMMQMFFITIWFTGAEEWNSAIMKGRIRELLNNPIMLRELIELIQYQYDRIDFIDKSVNLSFNNPLDLHCTYSRNQLLVAMDIMKPGAVQEGVRWLSDKKLYVLFVTLNKSEKDFSDRTMYEDYSINESLFHWQSQNATAPESPTGQRFINHEKEGIKVLMFVREFKNDRTYGGAMAYTFLGTATYVSHTGSRPMSIIWKMDNPIPPRFLKKTNKLMVG